MLYLASAPETRMALGFEGSADFIPFDDEVEEGELSERGSPQVQKVSLSTRVRVKAHISTGEVHRGQTSKAWLQTVQATHWAAAWGAAPCVACTVQG